MGYLEKTAYEGKAAYADRRMAENAKIETLTEEQHAALAWLCKIRHDMHANQMDICHEESANAPIFSRYIDEEIGEKLENCGLPAIDDMPSTWELRVDGDFYYVIDDEEREFYNNDFEKWFSEVCAPECADFMNRVNNAVENYLLKIDQEHGTNYCPTGATRIF